MRRGTIRQAALVCISVLALAACSDDDSFDMQSQVGPNPVLPEQHQYLFPPMHLAKVVGWTKDQTPTVPDGMQIAAIATELQHPRDLYVLPNGDILVVVMGWIESMVTSGGKAGPSNRITLLRDTNRDGTPDRRSVFLEHLNSPFGVALVGSDLYVADTDAIIHYADARDAFHRLHEEIAEIVPPLCCRAEPPRSHCSFSRKGSCNGLLQLSHGRNLECAFLPRRRGASQC